MKCHKHRMQILMHMSHFRHVEAEEKPNMKSKKGGAKGQVSLLKETIQLGCASHHFHSRMSIVRKEGTLGSDHSVKFLQEHVAPYENSGEKGSIARYYP